MYLAAAVREIFELGVRDAQEQSLLIGYGLVQGALLEIKRLSLQSRNGDLGPVAFLTLVPF